MLKGSHDFQDVEKALRMENRGCTRGGGGTLHSLSRMNPRVDWMGKIPQVRGVSRTIQFQNRLMVCVMRDLAQMVRTAETYMDFEVAGFAVRILSGYPLCKAAFSMLPYWQDMLISPRDR